MELGVICEELISLELLLTTSWHIKKEFLFVRCLLKDLKLKLVVTSRSWLAAVLDAFPTQSCILLK